MDLSATPPPAAPAAAPQASSPTQAPSASPTPGNAPAPNDDALAQLVVQVQEQALPSRELFAAMRSDPAGPIQLCALAQVFQQQNAAAAPRLETLSSDEFLQHPLNHFVQTPESIAGDLEQLQTVHENAHFTIVERFTKLEVLGRLLPADGPVFFSNDDANELGNAVTELQGIITQAKAEADEVKAILIELATDIAHKERSIEQMLAEIDALVEESTRLARQPRPQPHKSDELRHAAEYLKAEVGRATAHLQSQQADLDALMAAHESLTAQHTAATATVTHFQTVLADREAALAGAVRQFGHRDVRVQRSMRTAQARHRVLRHLTGIGAIDAARDRHELTVRCAARPIDLAAGPVAVRVATASASTAAETNAAALEMVWSDTGVAVRENGVALPCGDLAPAEAVPRVADPARAMDTTVRMHEIEARAWTVRAVIAQCRRVEAAGFGCDVVDSASVAALVGSSRTGRPAMVVQVAVGKRKLLIELDELGGLMRAVVHGGRALTERESEEFIAHSRTARADWNTASAPILDLAAWVRDHLS
ncbi:hypothetical protein AMAG_06309 [Allomyces macrogynus ATCC 38327]|uniref:Uncharacterized protein n=1 Tax=Allomyces macrogynus (strain ATCC 38327) TaxID=578462 RepID=A0A0L0SG69_ALLM3|nr:hypothetical protein AMAG_06309 [Allomyces macrogynus ATCC 38327]|eukprot:KNE61491.1 hypothetical protein AMAG_06309 [Allomyces macrogynus ATCC 38327]